MAKFYTGKGDDGTTGILGEGRVKKFDLRMETLGTLDELSAALGMARSLLASETHQTEIIGIQRKLYELMAEVAASTENAEKFHKIEHESIVELETMIDELSVVVESPQGFILPGDTPASAAISMARAITRRAERRTVELLDRGDITNIHLARYLNRLSALLYVLEIRLIQESNKQKPRLAKEKDE